MSKKDFLKNFSSLVDDWKNTSFTFNPKTCVPGIDDKNLTYGNGEEKKGIELQTCVLFVDIRNSVKLTKEKHISTMGKIYSVFTQGVLLAAAEEGGFVRNIIGDRVMVVFPPEKCFKKAINCAITINHLSTIIDKKFSNVDFHCGIGVDYGELNVMKAGIERKGGENDDNKGLIWVGYPANFASRLTDCANKEFLDVVYEVDAEFYEYNYFQTLAVRPNGWYRMKKMMTAEELAASLSVSQNVLNSDRFRRPYSITRSEKKYKYRSILVSDHVYSSYLKNTKHARFWRKEARKIKDIDFDVWGGDVIWKLD